MSKKKYSIRWENDEAVAFEIDDVVYESLDQIPDQKDLQKMMAMMSAAEETDFVEPEAESGPPPAFPPEKIILWVFTGVAILMLGIAAIATANNLKNLAKEKSAPGRVVDMVTRREYVNEQDRVVQEYYFPVVEFTAEDGRRRNVQMTIGSSSPEYEKGNEVTIRYDPENPLQARIDSFGSAALMWILPGITGILGIAFLGAVLLVQKVILRT
jgi:hypothetical protein